MQRVFKIIFGLVLIVCGLGSILLGSTFLLDGQFELFFNVILWIGFTGLGINIVNGGMEIISGGDIGKVLRRLIHAY